MSGRRGRHRAASAESPGARQRCPLCDVAGEETSGGAPAGYVRCPSCGTWFLGKRPSLGEIAENRNGMFANAFALPYHAEKRQARDDAQEVMRGYFKIRSGKPAALNAFGLSALDVQCELGFRMRVLEDYGWTVASTEASAAACEYAHRQSLDVKQGWLEDVGFGESRFDLALFCGRFGDLPKPKAVLAKLAALLKPGALVSLLHQRVIADGGLPSEEDGLFLYTAESLRRLFCQEFFSLVAEEGEGETRDFWFEPKSGKFESMAREAKEAR